MEPDEIESKIAINKEDPTAPARSSIRRRRSVRYSSSRRLHQQASSLSYPRRHANGNSPMRQMADRRYLLEDVRRRDWDRNNEESAIVMMNDISRFGAALNRGNSSISRAANNARVEITQRNPIESARASLHEIRSFERPSQRTRIGETQTTSADGNSGSYARNHSTAEFDEQHNLLQVNHRHSPPRHMSTPPNPFGETLERSSSRRFSQPLGSAAFTPGFPPAHRAPTNQADGRSSARRTDLTILADQISELRMLPQYSQDVALATMLSAINSMIDRGSLEPSQDHLVTEMEYIYSIRGRVEQMAQMARFVWGDHSTNERGSMDLPLLRRTDVQGARAPPFTLSHGMRDDLDGLGDRQRSFSPESVSWETMLISIPPDDHLPSAHSSFTSASASASASTLGSNSTPASLSGFMRTAPSAFAVAEPCPADESNSDGDILDEDGFDAVTPSHLQASTNLLAQANVHLGRIESLSRRLEEQRSRDENVTHRRLLSQRENELQRIEASLVRVERQIEDERSTTVDWQRPSGVRVGRERL